LAKTVSNHLDGATFAAALLSGINRVIGDQDVLNQINVYPVADGDTGTNLSLSLGAVLEILRQPADKSLGSLLASIADALLDSGRGNSGAIIAQFFQGVSDSAGDLTRFTTYTFSKAIRRGSDYAHDALSDPQEGTILSVIAAYADALAHQTSKNGDPDFVTLMTNVQPVLEDSLARTTEQLEVLRKAGVVDAGAKGFVDLISGMHDYIVHGHVTEQPDLSLLRREEGMQSATGPSEAYAYRFCTECIVSGTNIDRRKLREGLVKLGDSMVLAGTKRKAKIHIHVNDPTAVFDLGRKFGIVSAEKADDLHRQQHSSHDSSRHFAVITDSAADIADEDLERLDIHMVPCRIQFGDRGYLDKVSISATEFFAELERNPNHPTTSQPTPGDFRRQFQFLASHYPDVLSINLTGSASGTLEAARSAATRSNAPGRVHVINSLNASMGQGMLTVFAAECAASGMPVERAIAALQALIPRTHTYGMLSNLDYAVRGGRIPSWVKTVARFLHLIPIIRTTPDGKIRLSGFFFGKRNRIQKFARHVVRRERREGCLNVAVGHAVSPVDAVEIERILRERLPCITRLTTAELGAALGAHGGPGTLIIATQPSGLPGATND
jgi:DegV family protein with EDD domain